MKPGCALFLCWHKVLDSQPYVNIVRHCAKLLTFPLLLPRDGVMERIPEVMALLRAARALLNLHQEQVADLAGVSRQTIARIENESGTIPAETIERVRDALEGQGVMFLPSSGECGPAVGLRKKAPSKRPK